MRCRHELPLSHMGDNLRPSVIPAPPTEDAIGNYAQRQRERTTSLLSKRAAQVRVRALLTGAGFHRVCCSTPPTVQIEACASTSASLTVDLAIL